MNYKQYVDKLKPLYARLSDKKEQEIFRYLTAAYVWYHQGYRASKKVAKPELIKHLVSRGLMQMKVEKFTGKEILPDDRGVRETVRELLKRGYPILADSSESGYYIADSLEEIERPKAENEKRAKMILAVGQGYTKVANLIQYDRTIG